MGDDFRRAAKSYKHDKLINKTEREKMRENRKQFSMQLILYKIGEEEDFFLKSKGYDMLNIKDIMNLYFTKNLKTF